MIRLRLLALACLPQHALSRVVYFLARRHTRLKDPLVRWFIRHYGVDMREAAEPDPGAYATFNAFFTRALRPGSRPLAGDADTLVSPVDGRLARSGPIEAGALFQAKGIDYPAAALLGDADWAPVFDQGFFATLYLAPGDYHRVHLPLAGRLRRMVHVPGRLYPVAPWAVDGIPGLFTRNERVTALFDTTHGPMAVVLVGALNVGAIETTWAGPITPPRGRVPATTDYPAGPAWDFARGAEIGRFNLGSTVIVLLARRPASANPPAPAAPVRVGEALATLGVAAG